MSNTIIQLKSSSSLGNVPSVLFPGELAINYGDGKLYYGNTSNQAVIFQAVTQPAGLNQEIQLNLDICLILLLLSIISLVL